MSLPIVEKASVEGWTDEEIVHRVLNGDLVLFELLMRRHNQRVYRAIRSILRDDSESEDVMQEAYVRAYEHLAQFEGRAQFSTWLTRIAVNEALKQLTARGKLDQLDEERYEGEDGSMPAFRSNSPTPEANASRSELKGLLEEAILALPADLSCRDRPARRGRNEHGGNRRSPLAHRSERESPTASCPRTVARRTPRARRNLQHAGIRIPRNSVRPRRSRCL